MKIGQLIAKYLQENNILNVNGIGSFLVTPNTEVTITDKQTAASNPISYIYNEALVTDAVFVDFIIKETSKIRPLAIADLETYIVTAKQLLNISKPFIIDGVGTLVKETSGIYTFLPGNYELPKISTDNDRDRRLRQAKEVSRDTEIKYKKDYNAINKTDYRPLIKKGLGALTLLLLIAGIAWVVIKYIVPTKTTDASNIANNSSTNAPETTAQNKVKDTATVLQTSTINKPDSLGKLAYKAVIRNTDSATAYKRYNGLINISQPAVIYKSAEGTFKVAILVRSSVADTARIADSIHTYFLKGTGFSYTRVTMEQ